MGRNDDDDRDDDIDDGTKTPLNMLIQKNCCFTHYTV